MERLKIELRSADGEDTALGGGGEVVGGDERPNKSLEVDEAVGRLGLDAGVAVFVKLKSRPLDETEVVRCGCGLGEVLDARVSNNPPPEDIAGEVT